MLLDLHLSIYLLRIERFVYPSTSSIPKGKARYLLLVLLLCLCNLFKELFCFRKSLRSQLFSFCYQNQPQAASFSKADAKVLLFHETAKLLCQLFYEKRIFQHSLDLNQAQGWKYWGNTLLYYKVMRLWGCEVVRLWGCEVMRLWGYEVRRLWGYEVMRAKV